MRFVIAYIKPFKLEDVKSALKDAGVTGMTVVDARGFGRQAGQTEVYRGAEYEVDFVPKTRIELIVSAEETPAAVEAIRESAFTGEIGDGKIVVLSADDVVRIRTGERGQDAL
ncbi:MAG: P-II family nitrogen regulator [Actinobacteria bacterium]|nr:P-II family nitrogen regulator [Actinomycetota bacterium]